MALLTYQIAAIDNDPSPGDLDAARTYNFQDIQGTPIRATEQIEIFGQPGVDGHGARKTGKRGQPYQLISVEYISFGTDDATTLANAQARLALYEALQGDSIGVQVTQGSTPEAPVDVLNVSYAQRTRLIAGAAGSLVANPRALLTCRWTLVARPSA